MANENPTWGYTRIRGGAEAHHITRNKGDSQRPWHRAAPERGSKTPWKTFLSAHWDGLAAANFFSVELLIAPGPLHRPLAMRLTTRTMQIAGIRRMGLNDAGGTQPDPLYAAPRWDLLLSSGVTPLLCHLEART